MINNTDITENDQQIITSPLKHNTNACIMLKRLIGLKIFHMNIRSIQRYFDELSILLCSLDADFDVIVLTEAFINEFTSNYT